MAGPDDDPAHVAWLRHYLYHLSRHELLLVLGWIQESLVRDRRPQLRLVQTPSLAEPEGGSYDVFEVLGQVRFQLNWLSEHRLIELASWVERRLRMQRSA